VLTGNFNGLEYNIPNENRKELWSPGGRQGMITSAYFGQVEIGILAQHRSDIMAIGKRCNHSLILYNEFVGVQGEHFVFMVLWVNDILTTQIITYNQSMAIAKRIPVVAMTTAIRNP
jgi:hypothetical protein